MKKGKKASKKMTALIVPALAASLLLPIGSAFAAQATGINFSSPNFMGVYPKAEITAEAQGISTPMYQWWVKSPGAADAKCMQPYSQDNTIGFNELGDTAGKYEMWVTTVDKADYNNGSPNVDNTKTQYAFAYKDAGVQLTKAEIVNGKLEVAASANNIANPDFQFWFSNNPSDSNSWQCSWYGLGAERSIDLGGATGTFRVIAYVKDKDALADKVEYTVWSDTKDVAESALVVQSASAITTTVKNVADQELKFSVNGNDELTAAEFVKKYEGYNVYFSYNKDITGLTESAKTAARQGKIDASASPFNADFKYAVQVTDAEGNKVPASVTAADYAEVNVKDPAVAVKATKVVLNDGSDDWALDYVTLSESGSLKFSVSESENFFGETEVSAGVPVTAPTIKSVTSSDPTVAYLKADGTIKLVKAGNANFTIKFNEPGVPDYTFVLTIQAAQAVKSITPPQVLKVQANTASQKVAFVVNDANGEPMRADVAGNATTGLAVKINDGSAGAVGYTAATKAAEVDLSNKAAGDYTVQVLYNGTAIGSFVVEAVNVSGSVDSYVLGYTAPTANKVDLVGGLSATQTVNLKFFIKGVEVPYNASYMTGVTVNSSDPSIATATNSGGTITVTAAGNGKTGPVSIYLEKSEGDIKTELAKLSLEVVNTTAQVSELSFKEGFKAVVGTKNNPAIGDIDAFTTAQVVEALKAQTGVTLTAPMVESATFVEVSEEVTGEKWTGKVIVEIKAINGGLTKAFNAIVYSEEAAAIIAINAGNATEANYTDANITGVDATNLDDVNAAVAAAKTTKGSALTKAEIQGEVDLVVAVSTAQGLIDTLVDDVNGAANKTAAQAFVDDAQVAVNAVTALNAGYDTSAWDTVISEAQDLVDAMV